MFEIKLLEYQYPKSTFQLQVKNIRFEQAEIVSIIGANGSGKSTFYKLMIGAINANKSIFKIDNCLYKNLLNTPYKIGYHNAFAQLIDTLTVRQNALMMARIHKIKNPLQRIEELSLKFGIAEFLDRYPKSLSSGQANRAKLIRTLVHDPDIVILDEPTTGSDIRQIETILTSIKQLQSMGKLVVISTHHLYELSFLKPRIIGINSGKIVIDEKWSQGHNNPLFLRESVQDIMMDAVV